MMAHALMMGVVAEGINFFGIGELFLFLCQGSPGIALTTSMIVASLFCVLLQVHNCACSPTPRPDPSEEKLLAYVSDEDVGETIV